MKEFSIIYSNLTGQLFAWEGNREYQRKYLGNRVVLGVVTACNGDTALTAWKARNL
ncbi:hypothetical protein [Rhodoferax antarcticus]|uniref:Uncharacterized protein n=1 Tax=Rhodoferax antarcticus ANT.BR TaxID=1111071 RepID=A0A1Q8Y965_9BURK|nr:hypothetical protein [Rhodoferax antarcticus]OLP04565.1 hypothetical protein BLL52_4117 [Rhodoferax antarcticus ANT.BR]